MSCIVKLAQVVRHKITRTNVIILGLIYFKIITHLNGEFDPVYFKTFYCLDYMKSLLFVIYRPRASPLGICKKQ